MKIIGTGIGVSNKIVYNYQISESPQWVEDTLGIKKRHIGGSAVELGKKAGIQAIRGNVDMLIVATSTPSKIAPSTACLIAKEIGLSCPAFDINAVCSGFLYAMYLAEKVNKNILIIGVDTFSKITNFMQRDCVFFGDGAGAMMVTPGDNLKSIVIKADTDNNGFSCDHGKTFDMDGKLVYENALRLVPVAINKALYDAHLSISDIDYMVPHQPSKKILNAIADKIGFSREKVLMNMDEYANTSAGTIPILFHESKFNKGDKILFASIGSGWTYGAAVYEI